jgi:hypothetical protein
MLHGLCTCKLFKVVSLRVCKSVIGLLFVFMLLPTCNPFKLSVNTILSNNGIRHAPN